jgi:hypothetical protein
MEIDFFDSDELPVPPGDARILSLDAQLWPDGRRVGVEVEITPFQERPDLHIHIHTEQGQELASTSAIQIRQHHIAFTLHLRQPEAHGNWRVSAFLVYSDPSGDLGIVDRASTAVQFR